MKEKLSKQETMLPIPPAQSIIDALHSDKNSYSAIQIQHKVENGIITWEDLSEVFDDRQIQAIKDYCVIPEFPRNQPPMQLPSNCTEIYFWGPRCSGRTCAISSVLSATKGDGIVAPQHNQNNLSFFHYSNLFLGSENKPIIPLPLSSAEIPVMSCQFIEEKHKKHNACFIEVTSNVNAAIFKQQNGMALYEEERNQLDLISSYLKNSHNNKIHIFALEYGAAHSKARELTEYFVYQSDILVSIAQFLEQCDFEKSTVGVYGLVTKSDLIDAKYDTPRSERPRLAHEYVTQELRAFWQIINSACQRANIKDVKTISFSIGEIFAQTLCMYDRTDAQKVIKYIMSLLGKRGNILIRLKEKLFSKKQPTDNYL